MGLEEDENADLGIVSASIIKLALAKDSRDNITAMVVHFSDGSVWEEHQQDEIIGYQGLTKPDEEQDDEVKKQSLAILRKWGFPPEPIPCSYTGRWFKTMMQCPSGRAFYMDREAQKKHWKKHKKVYNAWKEQQKK